MESNKKLYTANVTDGKLLSIAGGKYRVVISGDDTNGEFAVIEMTVPPNAGPVPHAHKDIDESFYVLKGKVSFYSENGNFEAEEGGYINIPKGGLIHHFKNNSDEEAVLLCTVIPAGAEKMFEEVSNYFQSNPNLSDDEKKDFFTQMAAKYDTQLYPPDYLMK